MRWDLEIRLQSPPLNDDQFDALADALYELDGADPDVADTDLTASLAAGTLTISMAVEEDSPEGAAAKALGTVRAAVHKLGGDTSSWERIVGLPSLAMRPSGDREPQRSLAS
jgi:hypothetical protein